MKFKYLQELPGIIPEFDRIPEGTIVEIPQEHSEYIKTVLKDSGIKYEILED